MRKVYRVTVVEETTDDAGETTWDTVFEAAGTSPERLAQFAPAEVAAALGAEQASVIVSGPTTEELSRLIRRQLETVAGEQALPATDGPVSDGGREADHAPGWEAAPAPTPAKRKRRTKAEMEADRLAEEQAEQERQAARGDDVAPTAGHLPGSAPGPEAGYMTPDGPVVADVTGAAPVSPLPAGVPSPLAEPLPAANEPYNPFA